jgi:hypothetical protein
LPSQKRNPIRAGGRGVGIVAGIFEAVVQFLDCGGFPLPYDRPESLLFLMACGGYAL